MARCCLYICVLTWLYVLGTSALYEDQVGKFDWSVKNVGSVSHVISEVSKSGSRLVAASGDNVLAALSQTTGKILWRQVLEDSEKLSHLIQTNEGVVTVSGYLVRHWNTKAGLLYWQSYVPHPCLSALLLDNTLVIFGPQTVTSVSIKTGKELWSLVAPWDVVDYSDARIFSSGSEETIFVSVSRPGDQTEYRIQEEKISKLRDGSPVANSLCAMYDAYLACVSDDMLVVTSLLSGNKESMKLPARETAPTEETTIAFSGGFILVNTRIIASVYQLINDKLTMVMQAEGHAKLVQLPDGEFVVMALSVSNEKNEVLAFTLPSGRKSEENCFQFQLTSDAAITEIHPFAFKKTDGSIKMRVLTVHDDQSLHMVQSTGAEMWVREEALSALLSVEMVDLPVSDVEAQMEDEFGAKSARAGLLSQFVSRLLSQIAQLISAVDHAYHKYITGLRVVGETVDHVELDEDYLHRDQFNLHKIIVASSSPGKIFGLDSYTGSILWSFYLPGVQPFAGDRMPLFIQRTTAHFPHEPVAVVLARSRCSTDACPDVFVSFNPITGKLSADGPIRLAYQVKQATLRPIMNDEFLRPIVMLSAENKVHVHPEPSPDEPVNTDFSMFMFTAEQETSQISGFQIPTSNTQGAKAMETWRLRFTERLIALKTKPFRETVHTLGKVLTDRSVLYKYSNPNLVAAITETVLADAAASRLNVYLFDSVSGRVLYSSEHKKCSGPVHLVHSENWLVYSYNSVKSRRTEISVLELYEGEVQNNATAFSSLENNIAPKIFSQTYILGTSITALATTHTEKGISGKNIIMARSSGGLVEVPKLFLDPRRPLDPAKAREEGLPPYTPELPLSFENTINYNSSVYRIKEIHSEPSGLESTSLILARGLDLFFVQVAPSQKYDRLKDDFDYIFISAVVLAMIVGSYLLKKLSQRKALARVWK